MIGRKVTTIMCVAGLAGAAHAERVANPIAVFNGLDKITGVTTTFEISIGDRKRFGGLIVKPDVCYTRPVTEAPKTTSFVEVDELEADNSQKRVFTGWMFAESPGLNAVEHPVFDVWLTECQKPKNVAQRSPQAPAAPGAAAAPGAEELPPPDDKSLEPRRRVRR